METKEIIAICHDGCGIVKFTVFEDAEWDDYCFISYYSSTFYDKQSPIWYRIKEVVKMLWFIIRGRDFQLYEVSFNKENWEEFKKNIQDL